MLTVEKLKIYEQFDGDIDGWARASRGQASPGMTDVLNKGTDPCFAVST